jgi:hypothetical protein
MREWPELGFLDLLDLVELLAPLEALESLLERLVLYDSARFISSGVRLVVGLFWALRNQTWRVELSSCLPNGV